jgi:hypothetical protein
MRRCLIPLVAATFVLVAMLLGACSSPVVFVGAGPDPTAIPPTWQEHWFEHDQEIALVDSDDVVALYVDQDVDRAQTAALMEYASTLWRYTVTTYGPIGPGRLYVIFHKDRYKGCHRATYFEESHDYRNVIDCGITTYDEPAVFEAFFPHLAALIVESASHGRQGAPADAIWHQGKWAEFYRYDLYLGTGKQALADAVYAQWTRDEAIDSFPVENTHWFRDWSYPLWRDYGGAKVMHQFFKLLARDFPAMGSKYARADMTWGEFVHFMSGAAGEDLKPLATAAFGWTDDLERQLQAARASFPGLTY